MFNIRHFEFKDTGPFYKAIVCSFNKKRKTTKLALARKCAILWSAQEKRKKQLQVSVPVAQLPSSADPIFYPAQSDPSPVVQPTSTPPESIKVTISALQAALSDLYYQREQLETTIRVLTNRLDTLLQQQQNE